MWNYEKRLQYPVKITQTNPKIAQIILTQFGGPDGELAASMRYLAQRYTMPYKETTQMDYWKWINDPWPWQEGGC